MIVVAIPTYKRPQTLAVLLDTLDVALAASERAAADGVTVLVGDNDCDPATPGVVAEHLHRAPFRVLPVPAPGVSAVRESLAQAALEVPGVEWVVMLDDDGQVTEHWLDPLLETAESLGADLVGGPVLGDLPPGSSPLARASIFGGRVRVPTGEVEMLNGAQNVAVHRRALEAMERPWFDPALGRSGGEDYEFFRHARARGLRFAWCDEARVVEPTPPERLTNAAILGRVASSNRVGAHITHAYGGWPTTLRIGAMQGWWLTRALAAGVARRQPHRFYDAGLKAVGMAGQVRAIAELVVGAGPDLVRKRRRRR